VASVTVGTVASPPRFVNIVASFSGSSSQVPNFVDFILRIDLNDQPGGSEISFDAVNVGDSGDLVRSIFLPAGEHTINLEARANAAGASIDPVGRPQKDNASLMVFETAT